MPPDKWWLAKKLVYLINGFAYAGQSGLNIPEGLKHSYEKYASEGLEKMLKYVKERYLPNIDGGVWTFVREHVISFTKRMQLTY